MYEHVIQLRSVLIPNVILHCSVKSMINNVIILPTIVIL